VGLWDLYRFNLLATFPSISTWVPWYIVLYHVGDDLQFWLLTAEDNAADGGGDGDRGEDERWSNSIPDDLPCLLTGCRRLSQSCGQLAVNNASGLSYVYCFSVNFIKYCS